VQAAKKMPKDVLNMIFDQIILGSRQAKSSVPMCWGGRINLEKCCTLERCAKGQSCAICDSIDMAWDTKYDFTRCNPRVCNLERQTLNTIVEEILGQPKLDVVWPQDDRKSIKKWIAGLSRIFLEVGWKLSHEEIIKYQAMIKSLRYSSRLRKYK
jgi:hypothetical protein